MKTASGAWATVGEAMDWDSLPREAMAADQQRWDPKLYGRWATYVPELGRPLIQLLDPRPGKRALDLGCGNGTLTVHMAACGCSVLGGIGTPALRRYTAPWFQLCRRMPAIC